MKKIDELIKEIKESNKTNRISIDCLCDYGYTNYLQDTISEIADNYISIYNSDLLEWAKDNYSYIEDAIDEFGTPTDEKGNADFIKMIQQGQYMSNLEELNNNVDDMIKLYILDLLQKDGKEELTDEKIEKIDDLIESWKNDDILGSLEDIKESLEV